MKLDLIGIGPQRAGTTWLYECLRGHPDLCFPQGVKETFFFDVRFGNGEEWYASHFRHARPGQRLAEIGPTYLEHREAPRRVREHSPGALVVANLRHPAERTFSLYLHHLKKGRVAGSFGQAVEAMPSILDGSRYATHLPRWFREFGRERVLAVLHDDIAAHPERVLEQVYAFAALAPLPLPASAGERVNAASLPRFPLLARAATRGGDWLRERRLYGPINLAKRLNLKRVYSGGMGGAPRMDGDTRARLLREFAPDVAFVEDLLGRELPAWRT
ncbi:sulfotransferase [Longimicrobium sp.]|jgi:hypothetical protein|uniref:sulfotransferase family protein n=1 Tax=Longimicrobium sp. TaxID=2029185 RepID=UPI002ED8CAF2